MDIVSKSYEGNLLPNFDIWCKDMMGDGRQQIMVVGTAYMMEREMAMVIPKYMQEHRKLENMGGRGRQSCQTSCEPLGGGKYVFRFYQK